MEYRHNLITARIKKGLKQVEVAKHVKLAKSTYCEIEHGNHNPSWSVAQRLEQFFGIPASELLAKSEEPARGTG